MSAKQADSRSRGKKSKRTTSPGAIGPEPMSWPTAVWAPCEAMKSSAVAPCVAERALGVELDQLARELLAVDGHPAAVRARTTEQVDTGGHPRLGGALGAADPGELGPGLRPAAVVEEGLVDAQLDSVRAQVVGLTERELVRHDRLRHAELAADPDEDLEQGLLGGLALGVQLVEPEVLQWMRDETRRGRLDPADLHRMGRDVPRSADLEVVERVRDRQRHLVPELGRANRVGDDDDVRHRRRS